MKRLKLFVENCFNKIIEKIISVLKISGSFIALKFFASILVIIAGLLFLFGKSESIFRYIPLIFLEVVFSSSIGVIFLKKANSNCDQGIGQSSRFFAISAFSLALGDLIFGVDYYVLGFPTKNTLWFLLYHIPYMVWILTIGLGCAKYLDFRFRKKLHFIFLVLIGSLFFILQKKLILDYSFPKGFYRHEVRIVCSYFYACLQSITVPLLLLCSLSTRSRSMALYLCLGLGFIACDFGLRLQDVDQVVSKYPIFEIIWGILTYLSLLSTLKIYFEKSDYGISENTSFRFVMPFVGFVLGSVTLFALYALNLVVVESSFAFASLLLVFLVSWYFLNVWSIGSAEIVASVQEPGFKNKKGIPSFSEINKIRNTLNHVHLELTQVKQELKCWSHDIKSPLLALDVSARQIEASSSSENYESRELLGLAVSRLKGMVPEIDRLANNLELRLHDSLTVNVNVRKIIEDLVKEKEYRLGVDPSGHIEVECPDNIEIQLHKDKIAGLSRALSNLIDNSIESHPNENRVRIRVIVKEENIAENRTQRLSISIRDSGEGMSQEILEKIGIFGVSINKSSGSGFGIAQAKQFLSGIGGWLDYQSEVGVGTVVTVKIPLSTS